MPIQKQSYQIQGMRQDNLVGTGFSSKYAHEIMNMRLNTIGDYTTASWTTEKGTKSVEVRQEPIPDTTICYNWITNKHYSRGSYEVSDFKPIGQAVINNNWVLFGIINNLDIPNEKYDVIINLRYNENESYLYGRILYWGQLNFNEENPIETIVFYENEKIQKVYWTDGLNQPRVINIKGAEGIEYINGYPSNITTQFDFIQEVSLNETVTITKDQSGAGLFPPCTVKYAISYYNKYGQETNIVYDSSLYYPTIGERACSEDELSGDSFYIKVENLDLSHGFDYIRLYSIVKTTNNATPIVRIVDNKSIKGLNNNSSVIFHDTNTTGEIIDPSIIQFIGGKEIIAHTFDQKNNTLFLGNIHLNSKSVTKELLVDNRINLLAEAATEANFKFESTKNSTKEPLAIRKEGKSPSVYQYINQLNPERIQYKVGNSYAYKDKTDPSSQYVKHFKYDETYRFGIQFQDNKGVWSEVVYLNDVKNKVRPFTEQDNTECIFPEIKYTIPSTIVEYLQGLNYKKARLVCCYPTNADRSIIAQGVLCPTVFNNHWKELHAPDAMSSWFFRPNDKRFNESEHNYNTTILPCYHNEPLDCAYYINGSGDDNIYDKKFFLVPEVQSVYHANIEKSDNQTLVKADEDEQGWQWLNDKSVYKVNKQILTFHSPEIEFDESIRTLPSENWCVKIVGQVPINSFAAKYYLDANLPQSVYCGDKGKGFWNELFTRAAEIPASQAGSHQTLLGAWNDANLYTKAHKGQEFVDYVLYPFQRKSSLNNYVQDILDWKVYKHWKSNDETEFPIKQTSELHSKVLSHILYSTTCSFTEDTDILNPNSDNSLINSSNFTVFDTNEVIPYRIKNKGQEDFIYYGNVNSISPISDGYKKSDLCGSGNSVEIAGAYPIATIKQENNGWFVQYTFDGVHRSSPEEDATGVYVSDPVEITYKSTPHGVFYTKALTGDTLDRNGREGNNFSTNTPYLYLAEVYTVKDPNTIFGGKPTIDNPINNIYVPCGPTINLNSSVTNTVYGYEGDTYYMRYDNLKTYPYATDDTNQIVEILSFMVETRINLDGRHDRNRGLLDNTMVTNTNFNLINKSYTQDNNTFTFLTLDRLSAELDYFANQITWTNSKVSGEEVDAWTNITLASTADAEGNLGSITKILNYNDRLMLFQDHGLAQISFNENTAISTESGVPLELAKTGKYTGLNYYTREIGCQNKWSISKSKNGLLWIDDSRQELLALGENIQSLSTVNGFDAFMIKQLPLAFKSWSPKTFDNFVTYYDKLSNDVYYINKNKCLAWNEQTGSFTSFYNYENVPYISNIGTHTLMWKNGIWAAREANEYSKFFNASKDYWMTIVCDGQTDKGNAFSLDKVFNNIEYRADVYNEVNPHGAYNKAIFNKKAAWNGYQFYKEFDIDGIRKFNTWRVQLPRATYENNVTARDRIRNPFCYIKLLQDNTTLGIVQQNDRIILHDLAVYFDMK